MQQSRRGPGPLGRARHQHVLGGGVVVFRALARRRPPLRGRERGRRRRRGHRRRGHRSVKDVVHGGLRPRHPGVEEQPRVGPLNMYV